MSTKTSIKRIALVAVASLGLGLLSVTTSQAAFPADNDVDGDGVSTLTSITGYVPLARVDQKARVVFKAAFKSGEFDAGDVTYLAARFVAGGKPSGSALTNTSLSIVSNNGSDVTGITIENGSVSGKVYVLEAANANTAAVHAEVNFTPDVAGEYSIQIWNDKDGSGVYNAGEKTANVTFSTSGKIAKISVANVGGNSFQGEKALLKISLSDSTGKATLPVDGELIALSATNNADADLVFDSIGTASTDSLTVGDFANGTGIAYVTADNADTETNVITAKGDGDLSATLSGTASITYRDDALAADATTAVPYGTSGVDGWVNGADYDISTAAQTLTWKVTIAGAADPDASQYAWVKVADTNGKLVGTPTDALSQGGDVAAGSYAIAYDLGVTIAATKQSATIDITSAAQLSGAKVYEVTADGVTKIVNAATATPSAVDLATTSFTTITGGSYSVDATLMDQFGNGLASYPLSAIQSGRNSGAAAINKVTDADGAATFLFTDKGIVSTGTSDAIDFYSGASLDGDTDLTVTYVATLAGTVTVDSSTALNAIDTDSAKAATVDLTFTALDSNSAPIVGLPITVVGVGTGTSVSTGSSTVYTGADGKAVATVYSSKTGVQSWTGTASLISKSATATRTFVNAAADAKVVAVTTADGSVKATVTDNYGNPVKGVNVDFSRTGGATFGGYASLTVKTDASGVAEALVQGSGTVTASLAEADYAKSAWIAGYLGKTSSATASTTAIAGVATASIDVTGSSQTSDAIDAATDAVEAANAATDAANAAAEAADAATAAAQDAQAAVADLAAQVATLISGIKAQITRLTNLVIKIQKKVKA